MKVRIVELENELWTAEVGPDINDPAATAYSIVHTPAGLCLLMNSDVPYGGWLAKNVVPLLAKARSVTFCYTLTIDDATLVAAQVAETDFKLTDDEGWTYDLSAQWLMAKERNGQPVSDWILQVDEEVTIEDGGEGEDGWMWKWRDTNVTIAPFEPQVPVRVEIEALIDYEHKNSSILSVTVEGMCYPIEPAYTLKARETEGWAPMELVAQLQQCNNHMPGGYELRFNAIGYELEIN
jgi:hypothetical protein